MEAGRGELRPFLFIVALDDFQKAIEAAKFALEVTRPLYGHGNRAPPIYAAELVHPVDARTIDELCLAPGQLWNVYDPPLTDWIEFAHRP